MNYYSSFKSLLCEAIMLHRIVTEGRKEIDVKEVTKSLEKKGCEIKDIETSIDIMGGIIFFDAKIFPHNPLKNIAFCFQGIPGVAIAYSNLSDQAEQYQVKVPGILKDINDWEPKIVSFEGNDGQRIKINDCRKATFEEKAIAIMSRGVRYRWQNHAATIIHPQNIYYDSRVNAYVRWARKVMENNPQKFYEGVRKENWPREFDARITERMVIGNFYNETDEAKICETIKMEPYSIGITQT